MKHDYKEGPYSTGTLIERLEEMCGCGEEWGILRGRDVWPDDVLEAIERIKQLEAALAKVAEGYQTKWSTSSVTNMLDIAQILSERIVIARKALEGTNGP